MSLKFVYSNKAPKPIGPYSQAIKSGNYLFCSGQIPIDSKTGVLVSDDIRLQTEQVFNNIIAVLAAEDLNLQQVVKCTIFLTDLDLFSTVNTVFGEYFKNHKPARSTIQVAGLPMKSMVEIEVIASYEK